MKLILDLEIEPLLKALLIVCYILVTLWAGVHVVLFKKNTRSALLWLGLIIFSPLFGVFIYYVFGINRIYRKALKLNKKETPLGKAKSKFIVDKNQNFHTAKLKTRSELFAPEPNLSLSPFYGDTLIDPLVGGTAAFGQMLRSIRSAKSSVCLLSYIFYDDQAGRQFTEELALAVQRGVQVRVLLDHVGSVKFFSNVVKTLKSKGIPAEAFLPIYSLIRGPYANLRNHRKLLIVDGTVAYLGGMNITEQHYEGNKDFIPDVHFKVSGEIVHALQKVFVDDWEFVTKEKLQGPLWFPPIQSEWTDCLARVIPDVPGEEPERMSWQFMKAISIAKKSIKIVTPYFLPTSSLYSALATAVFKGVLVEVIVPQKIDHPLILYAMKGSVSGVIAAGVKMYESSPPFNHSKYLIVDDDYISLGSSNWDKRSLKLNYELNLEVLSHQLVEKMKSHFYEYKKTSTPITLESLNSRPLLIKLRDAISRLFTPYL